MRGKIPLVSNHPTHKCTQGNHWHLWGLVLSRDAQHLSIWHMSCLPLTNRKPIFQWTLHWCILAIQQVVSPCSFLAENELCPTACLIVEEQIPWSKKKKSSLSLSDYGWVGIAFEGFPLGSEQIKENTEIGNHYCITCSKAPVKQEVKYMLN